MNTREDQMHLFDSSKGDKKMINSKSNFGRGFIIFASAKKCQTRVSNFGERTSFLHTHMHHIKWSAKKCWTWEIQYWGSVHHFCIFSCTIWIGRQKYVEHGVSNICTFMCTIFSCQWKNVGHGDPILEVVHHFCVQYFRKHRRAHSAGLRPPPCQVVGATHNSNQNIR